MRTESGRQNSRHFTGEFFKKADIVELVPIIYEFLVSRWSICNFQLSSSDSFLISTHHLTIQSSSSLKVMKIKFES